MKPDQYNKDLDDLVMFLAQVEIKLFILVYKLLETHQIKLYWSSYIQVAHCFPLDLVSYPQELMDILQKHPTTLHPDMRKVSNDALHFFRS
jgi:predicted nucleic acid-binding protein